MEDDRNDVVRSFAEVKRILTASSILLGCVSRGHKFTHNWTTEERAAYWSQRLHMAQQHVEAMYETLKSTKEKMEWSKPYYGVQHLQDTQRGVQVSVENHGSFAVAYMLQLDSTTPYTPVWGNQFPTVEEARRKAERAYQNRFGIY